MSRGIVLVAGTRPEFVKLQPVALALSARGARVRLVVTNQHSRPEMRDAFLGERRWGTCVATSLETSADGDSLALIASIVRLLPAHLGSEDIIVVQGDTTTVLAAALVANKRGLMLAHVEAGLRSGDQRMPEEHNRRLCDHLADLLFAPTAADAENLRRENCIGAVHVVGNTALDAVRINIKEAPALAVEGLCPGKFVLMTIHRQENLADRAFLEEMVAFIRDSPEPVLVPIHPRTRDTFERVGLWQVLSDARALKLCAPMEYPAFLSAMRDARVIVTDSGGIQEEATAPEVRTPVVVVRRSTERPAAVVAGFSRLVAPSAPSLRTLVDDLSWFRPTAVSPFGDGHAADSIAAIVTDALS